MYMLAYDCQICGSPFGINKGKAQETRKKGPCDWKQEETPGKEEKAVGQSERESKEKWAGGSFKMKAHFKSKINEIKWQLVPLMNSDAKICNQILDNWIQGYLKNIKSHGHLNRYRKGFWQNPTFFLMIKSLGEARTHRQTELSQ